MRNYIILNNKNSNTINGLIIQELAPISKPLQRTQVETIDGRDGDIVTPLGYAAYNKKIKIGLYGNFDINEVIAYFATKGTVIFSNELDKYYYYQIVDQIDYERLVRYRVATVTMHVQPFKYSATEGTITVDTSDTVSDEGSDIALDGTAEAPFNTLRHKGNATQKILNGINLIDVVAHTGTDGGISWAITESTIIGSGTASSATSFLNTDWTPFPQTLPIGTYTFSIPQAISCDIDLVTRNSNNQQYNTAIIPAGQTSITVNQPRDMVDFRLALVYMTTGQSVSVNIPNKLQFEAGDLVSDFEPYVGGIPSPNPDYPQDIQVLTGDSTVKITGNNLAKMQDGGVTTSGITASRSSTTGEVTLNGTSTSTATINASTLYTIPIVAGETYTISANNAEANSSVSIRLNIQNVGSYQNFYLNDANQTKTFTSDYTGNCTLQVRVSSGKTLNNYIVKPQIELGNQASAYEIYKEQSYVIPFGDTYLAKIGNYVDEPVKVDGTWYIRRAIGKVVLDGSNDETWAIPNTGTNTFYYRYRYISGVVETDTQDYWVCNMVSPAYIVGTNTNQGAWMTSTGEFRIRYGTEMTTANWRTFLSNNNMVVYYALATPTDEVITDQDLIDALDELYDQAHSYKGHTHITATAADGNAPAVLAVDVNEDNESTVTNAGNTTSRPIITIYGQGDIGVYINDVEVLDIALGDEEYITLDSVEMEAYKDTTANLKNRLVTGDYSKLALNAGANKIRFTGKVTKYEISKYSRWL